MNYHTILHSLDIQKDAFEATPKIKRKSPLFQACMMKLFGKEVIKNTYNKKKNKLQKNIQEIPRTPYIPIKIFKKTDLKTNYDSLPSYIKFAIQDAGAAPINYNTDLSYLITPASYLDPGLRTPLPPNYHADLNVNDIKELQIPYLKDIRTGFDSKKSCHIHIDFNFENDKKRIIHVVIDRYYEVYGKDSKYFLGNSEKNRWFLDSENTVNKENIEEGIIYMVCKLLGDTLQVYYGKMFKDAHDTYDQRVCVFTNDKHVQYRSCLYDVPVVIQNYNKNNNHIYEGLYYPSSKDTPLKIRDVIINEVISENMHFILTIKDVISYGKIYVENKVIFFNTTIIEYLEDCIGVLEECNKTIKTVNHHNLSYTTFKKLASMFRANCFVYNENGKYFLVSNTMCFLWNVNKENDLIRRYGKNIYEILVGMSEEGAQIENPVRQIHNGGSVVDTNKGYTIWKILQTEVKRILLAYFEKDLERYSMKLNKILDGKQYKNISYDGIYSIEELAQYHSMCICYTIEPFFDVLGKVFIDEKFLGFYCIRVYFDRRYVVLTHERFLEVFLILTEPDVEDKKKQEEKVYNILEYIEDDIYRFPENREIKGHHNEPPILSFKYPQGIPQTAGKKRNVTRRKRS